MRTDIEASGTKQESDALLGAGLLQSPEEWNARNRELSDTINALLRRYMTPATKRGLDVGCMNGELTDLYGSGLSMQWYGIDPDIEQEHTSEHGAVLRRGFANDLDFPDEHFDCITFANVYEHIPPGLRDASWQEFRRVLVPNGIVVGQLPNPYFPIESHSRLPFMGYLPRALQRQYWRLTPTGWDFDSVHFFTVTISNLEKVATAAGFKKIFIRNFNYSPQAIPASVRWAAVIHARLGILPWSWQFVFSK